MFVFLCFPAWKTKLWQEVLIEFFGKLEVMLQNPEGKRPNVENILYVCKAIDINQNNLDHNPRTSEQ